ncbi:hypothetical protein VTL71DRAFT_187 [Oculimacula yallundae]|uniref:Peptidase M48 domain-containing protein n=1 Tax=Oculimacula yallundae TaxID=86028 RepID=A0ABR4D1N3_9HELO
MALFRVLPIARHGVASALRPHYSLRSLHVHRLPSLFTPLHIRQRCFRNLSTTAILKRPDPGPNEPVQETRRARGPGYIHLFRRNRIFRYGVLFALIGTVSYYRYFLEQVPDEDGRNRLMFFSQDSIGRQCVVKYKRWREMYRNHLVGLDDGRARRYHRILEGIIEANGLDTNTELGEGRWQVMVLESEKSVETGSGAVEIISIVLPGKKAIVSTGTLTKLSDEELAHLICHDLAHILLNHRREQHSAGQFWTPILFTLIFLDWKMLIGQIVLIFGADHWWYKGVQGKQEVEADRLGMRLAAKAGYEPDSARRVWKRLKDMAEPGERIGDKQSVKNMPERLERMNAQQEKLERYLRSGSL